MKRVSLESALIVSAAALISGLGLLGSAIGEWQAAAYGALDYGVTMRKVIPGMTLTVLGVQTTLSSFYLSILGLSRK
jgi:hypothetical protein